MKAILCCGAPVRCLPVRDLPEALLPIGCTPLIVHLLRFLSECGCTETILIDADDSVRHCADALNLRMQLRYEARLPVCDAPTLVLRRLCLPDWDAGELCALCGSEPLRLRRTDGTDPAAELWPAGLRPDVPPAAAITVQSGFAMPQNPTEYRLMQMDRPDPHRIGEGVEMGRNVTIDARTIIGHDCRIGDHAELTDCVIGDGVQIGAGCRLRRCVICRHALVDREAVLEDAVIEEGAIVPPAGQTPVRPRMQYHSEDGICRGLPRWHSPETALQAGCAMTALSDRIAIGCSTPDARPLADAAAAGAVCQGAEVWDMGVCSLAQMAAASLRAHCGVMLWVQGGSTPLLRPFEADGRPLTQAHAAALTRALGSRRSARPVFCGKRTDGQGLHHLWEADIRQLLPETDYEIAVSCGNTALRETAERLLSGGKGARLVLGLSEDGTSASVFSTESGLIRPDALRLLSLLSLKTQGKPLVLPDAFHPAAEAFAARHGGRILHREGAIGDGILLFAHFLRILSERHISAGTAAALLPPLYTLERTLFSTKGRSHVENCIRENPDPAVHIAMPLHSRLVQLRVHADSMEAAQELCGFWEQKLGTPEAPSA